MRLKALYRIDAREGAHNRISVEYCDGIAKVRRYCETEYDDGFVMKDTEDEYRIDLTEQIEFLEKHMKKNSGNDYELTVGKRTVSGDYDDVPDYLLEFQRMIGSDLGFVPKSEKVRYEGISEGKLKSLLDEKIITKWKFGEISSARKKEIETHMLLNHKEYPFTKEAREMAEDCDSGLLPREMFDCFAWCARNVVPKEDDISYVKLRLSLWGQRLLGRYDTCEYLADGTDLSERRYSVHGTLFEGCGNYKAPESAIASVMDGKTSERLYGFVQGLHDGGFLGKDYSTPGVDCSLFDLYVRFGDGSSSHTKGTSEYPQFIRFIMYLIDAKDLI